MKKRLVAILASLFAATLLWSGMQTSASAGGNDWERRPHRPPKAWGGNDWEFGGKHRALAGNDWEFNGNDWEFAPSSSLIRGNDWE